MRRWSVSAVLRAVTAEAGPRRQQRIIGPSRAEAQRLRRAEDRDALPFLPRKADCPGCVASRDADSENRWPIGDCGPECRRRTARRAS